MISLDLLAAVVLITSPDLPAPAPVCRLDTMQAVAVSMELMDPQECRYTFNHWTSWGWDLKLVRDRYADLADAPPAWDALRFPHKDHLAECMDFNCRYRQFLDDRKWLFPQDVWAFDEAIGECGRLWEIYDTARDAQCEYYYVTVRRRALKKLREMIGAEAYYNGCLPPHVPAWRFQLIGE